MKFTAGQKREFVRLITSPVHRGIVPDVADRLDLTRQEGWQLMRDPEVIRALQSSDPLEFAFGEVAAETVVDATQVDVQ